MKFKHLFYDNTVDFRKISKRRLVMSIVLGLLSSFIIYFTFSVLIDGFRLVFTIVETVPILISESNRSYYNLFFAALSLIFGNSIFISLLLSRPSAVFSKGNTKRFRIFNEQIVLNGFFMSWFGKMATVFGSFSVLFLERQFFIDYSWVFILLVLVMYLETWKTLLLVLGKKKYRLLSIHFLVFIALSFGLSKINIVKYKQIDIAYLKGVPTYNFPDSYFNSSSRNLYRNPLIKIGLTLDEEENILIRTEGREFIQINELGIFMANERYMFPEEFSYRITVRLSADKDMKIKYVKAFEAELFNQNSYKIWYQTNNTNSLTNHFETKGFTKRLGESALVFKDETITPSVSNDGVLRLPTPAPPPISKEYYLNKTIIKIEVDNIIKFNNKIINEKELVKAFETRIDSITLFEYNLNPETAYQNYITVLSAHLKAIQNKRQNKATFDISGEYYHYNKEEKDKLRKLMDEFPTLIKEVKKGSIE